MPHLVSFDPYGREAVPTDPAWTIISSPPYECPLRFFDPLYDEVGGPPDIMSRRESTWWPFLGIGIIILIEVLFVGWAPSGPWKDESFTLGVFGLIGLFSLYVGWFRWKFKINGLIPWLSLWNDVAQSGKLLVTLGVVMIFSTWFAGGWLAIPPAGGLILNLIASLLILQGTYAILTTGLLNEP